MHESSFRKERIGMGFSRKELEKYRNYGIAGAVIGLIMALLTRIPYDSAGFWADYIVAIHGAGWLLLMFGSIWLVLSLIHLWTDTYE
jgi:hypothetical protein